MTVPYAGFSIEGLTLPNEDGAAHRRLYDTWMAAYPYSGPIERGFVQQAVVALIEKRRIERIRITVRTERVRTAVLGFDRAQEDDVVRCVYLFNQSCEDGLRDLTRSAAGCRWAINHWEQLQTKLTADGTWYGLDQITAIQLQGVSACLDQLCFAEAAYITALDCLVAQPNPKQKDIDRILDPRCIPKSILDRDRKLWPGNPAESKARLQAIVDRELPRLKALEATLRVQYEDPARAEAADQALADATRVELPLLCAERMHEQSYTRAVNGLIKVRKQKAAAPVPPAAPRWELDETVPILGPDATTWSVEVGAWCVGETERPRPSG
jgi:hypothetical protein